MPKSRNNSRGCSFAIKRGLETLIVGTAFLGTSIAQVPTAQANSPSPGTIIENQATGSFVNPATSDRINIESNIVQVTVAEVAGVTLTPVGIQEAPASISNPGPDQDDGDFDASDVVYFLFTATNVGNDPTQFFIPGAPSSLTNGTQAGQIEIIALDPDGATGPTDPLDFSSLPITIRPEGNNTGDATVLGLPVGAIPAGGTITLRVPVKLDSGLVANDTVSLTLGDVSPNNNSAATQNQDYSDGGNNLDFYTQDNQETDNITNEAEGLPINGDTSLHRKEASASSIVTIGGTASALYTLSGTLFRDLNGSDAQDGNEPGLGNVTVRLYIDVDNNGELTLADDSNGDGMIDSDDAIAITSSDDTGFYQFNRPDGNYLIEVDTLDSDLIGLDYGGIIGSANDPLNLPRNADLAGANITTGLDFPFDSIPSNRDYGDAPDTSIGNGLGDYNTLAYHNGPYHVINPDLYIGTPADADDGTLASALANEDDVQGLPEDEGSLSFPTLKVDDTGYSVNNISVTNDTGTIAYLVGWIDFDRSGTFDADESVTQGVSSSGTQTISLSWSSLPTDISAGATYARFRLTTDLAIATGNAATSVPDGGANDGEVEDYQIAIATASGLTPFACSDTAYQLYTVSSPTQLASIDFDSGAFNDIGDTSHNLNVNATGFNPADNLIYGSLQSSTGGTPGDIVVIDSTGNTSVVGSVPGLPTVGFTSGDFIADNQLAFVSVDTLYVVDVVNLTFTAVALTGTPFPFDDTNDVAFNPVDGLLYRLSKSTGLDAQLVSINPVTGEVREVGDRVTVDSGLGAMFADRNGHIYGAFDRGTANLGFDAFVRFDLNDGSFTPIAPSPEASGNDGASCNQAILFEFDYGDAPSGYGNASHAISAAPDVYLGTVAPDDDGGKTQNTANGGEDGSGDDDATFPQVDDEDGITTFPVLSDENASYTTTLTVNNESADPATVLAWIDLDQSGTFDEDELATVSAEAGDTASVTGGQVDAGSSGTVTLTWANLPGIVTGDTYVRVRISTQMTPSGSDGGEDEAASSIVKDGEVEDYPITIGLSPQVLLVKRITAINGQQINPNDNSIVLNAYEDGSGLDDEHPNWPDVSPADGNPDLLGAIAGGEVRPDDEVEYTIYFLSTGSQLAQNVVFCDRIPDGQTFVPNPTFSGLTPAIAPAPDGVGGEDRGILVSHNGDNFTYTNIGGDDTARFYPPDSGLPPACNLLLGQTEHNGAIVVNLGDLPSATAPGSPVTSYGFIRFRAKVDE